MADPRVISFGHVGIATANLDADLRVADEAGYVLEALHRDVPNPEEKDAASGTWESMHSLAVLRGPIPIELVQYGPPRRGPLAMVVVAQLTASGGGGIHTASLAADTFEAMALVFDHPPVTGGWEFRTPGGKVRLEFGDGPLFAEELDRAGRPAALAFYVRGLPAFVGRARALGFEVHEMRVVLGIRHLDIAMIRTGQVWLELIERRRA